MVQGPVFKCSVSQIPGKNKDAHLRVTRTPLCYPSKSSPALRNISYTGLLRLSDQSQDGEGGEWAGMKENPRSV